MPDWLELTVGHSEHALTDETVKLHCFNIKVKVKAELSLCFTKHRVMQTYWGNGCITSRIL
jgi:hypothetical protein